MKDRERWGRKYVELICKTTLNISSTISSFCFISSPLQSLKTVRKKLHACQLQSRTKDKPLPLWALIVSQGGQFPTLLQENLWLLCCSYGGIQTAEQTVLVTVGKTGWSSHSFSKFLHFCITLPASSRGSNSSPWYMAQNNCDALLKVAPSAATVCQYWSPSPHVGESPCFQPRVRASVWVQLCPVLANLKYSWPQDVPKQSMKKEKKPWLFFRWCIWEYSLNFWVRAFRIHFFCFQVLFCLLLLPLPYPFALHPKHKSEGRLFLPLKSENVLIPGYEALGNILGGEVGEEVWQPKKECNKPVISFQSIKLHTLELVVFMTT